LILYSSPLWVSRRTSQFCPQTQSGWTWFDVGMGRGVTDSEGGNIKLLRRVSRSMYEENKDESSFNSSIPLYVPTIHPIIYREQIKLTHENG
jgi:hypothetical protein